MNSRTKEMNNPQNLDFAEIIGGQPFQKRVPVGQLNLPTWEKFEDSFKGIFSRQYYTNQGPLTQELELKLQKHLGVKHAICMTNETIGLMIAAKALDLKGKVICPAFAFAATAQSISWAGLDPVFCDVGEDHQLSASCVKKMIDKGVSAILGVHMWGNSCNPTTLREIAQKYNLKLYFDSSHAFGSIFNGKKSGNYGALAVFSFNKNNILSSLEGGCVCTNDDDLAARLRNIRSSYGAGKIVDIPLTGNGRMSEAQAAMALLSFQDYNKNKERNRKFVALYEKLLNEIPGIKIIKPDPNDDSNFQSAVIEISERKFGISGHKLYRVLFNYNIESVRLSGLHKIHPYDLEKFKYAGRLPTTDRLCKDVLQLPSGQNVSAEIIQEICKIIRSIYEYSDKINDAKILL